MRISSANREAFWQCPIVWILIGGAWCLSFFGFIRMGILRCPLQVLSIDVLIISLVAGFVVNQFQVQITTCPFSWCLPGYLPEARRSLFFAGLCVSPIAAIFFVLFLGTDIHGLEEAIWAAWAALFTNVTVFFLGAALAMSRIGVIIGLLLVPTFWLLHVTVGMLWSSSAVVVTRIIADSPIAAMLLGSAVFIAMWHWMGHASRFRLLQIKAGFRQYRPDHLPVPGTLRCVIQSRIERFGLGSMRHFDCMGRWQCACGAVYATVLWMTAHGWIVGLVVSSWFAALALSLYIPWAAILWVGCMTTSIPALVRRIEPCSYAGTYIAGGRRERLFATLVLSLALCFLAVLCVLLMVLASVPLASSFCRGSISLAGQNAAPLSPRLALFPLVLFPLCGFLELTSFRGLGLSALSSAIVLYAWWYVAIPSTYILFGAVVAWPLFVLIVRRVALRCDLVECRRRGGS